MFKKILTLMLVLSVGLIISACGKDKDKTTTPTEETTTVEPPIIDETDLSFSYYNNTKLNSDKVIYVMNTAGVENLSYDLSFTAQAIQGLFARDEVTFYFDGRSVTNMINTDRYHLDQTAEQYDLDTVDVTLAEAVDMYKAAWATHVESNLWGSQIPLDIYNSIPGVKAYTETGTDGYGTPGFILYRKGTVSVNIAATLSGITGFLPVEISEKAKFESMGLVEKMNVDSIVFDYQWLFENVMSEINPSGLIHQDYESAGGLTNPFIKDYGITNKYMYVYYDSQVNASETFKVSLHSFLEPNRPIFGYTYSEDSDVAFFSKYGQFIVPTDYTYNLSYLAAEEFRSTVDGEKVVFKQPNQTTDMTADPNKHYVAFIVSDGDNETMWQNTAPFAPNFMQAPGRENDEFPVTWSMTPSLADLVPSVLSSIYGELSNDQDHFAAPVSGHGYINAGGFLDASSQYFGDYLSKLDVYMKKADLGVVTVIGAESKGQRSTVLDGYAQVDAVKGGIVYEGSKYFGGVKGGVYWSNGKPFVGPRDSLWETTPEFIAARLNMYPTDPTKIDGYSIINVHPWSHSYNDIRTIANMLEDNVEVVSMDQLFQLMTDNITDQTNPTTGYTVPEMNGISITREQLEENPALIPVNPLFNDFLLWEEDWLASTGTISHASGDSSNSNVGTFLTGLTINSGATATKQPFNLPNMEDLWVSFVARADSTNFEATSTFEVKMTVDGVTKVVVSQATLKGVTGTGTPSGLKGDGWQYFAFPVSQYFPGYEGHEAKIDISVKSGTAMKIDKFEISQKLATPNGEFNPYNNQFTDGNTEDWLLGHMFMTSQYYYWGALNKDNGLPYENGAIQTDTSDGGGDEKRNANTNLWMAKNYVLPESDQISINYNVDGGFDGGSSYKVSMYVGGEYLVLTNWNRVLGDAPEVSISLSELAPTIDFSGAEVTIVIEVRDSGVNNGVGESLWFRSITTTTN